MFKGAGNRLTMNQTYTWEFQCQYELQSYPLDTQNQGQQSKELNFCYSMRTSVLTNLKKKSTTITNDKITRQLLSLENLFIRSLGNIS